MRTDWHEYFINMALQAATRSTCRRRQIGAVIVKDKVMISTGYNGAPRGIKDCLEMGCLRDELGITSGTRHEICRAVHAEQNAIIFAGLERCSGAILYTTTSPCIICAKMIIQARIQMVIYSSLYTETEAKKLLKEANVGLVQLLIPTPNTEVK